jgi:hypothetical protein
LVSVCSISGHQTISRAARLAEARGRRNAARPRLLS